MANRAEMTDKLDPGTGRLCNELHSHHGQVLNLLIPSEDHLSLWMLEPRIPGPTRRSSSLLLDTILRDGDSVFDRRRKLALAYCVALYVWQYYGTRWMPIPWSREQIHIVKEKSGQSWPYSAPARWIYPPKSTLMDGRRHKLLETAYPHLMALGILLVEIIQQSPFSNRSQLELDEDGVFENFSTYCDLKAANMPNWNGDYAAVVDRCFSNATFASCRDAASRRQVIRDEIVTPLERMYVFGITGALLESPPRLPAQENTLPPPNTQVGDVLWPALARSADGISNAGGLLASSSHR